MSFGEVFLSHNWKLKENVIVKLAKCSREQPKSFLSNSYYTKLLGKAQLFFLDWLLLICEC